jgi:hypothetical protein
MLQVLAINNFLKANIIKIIKNCHKNPKSTLYSKKLLCKSNLKLRKKICLKIVVNFDTLVTNERFMMLRP